MAEEVTIYADRIENDPVKVAPGGALEWDNQSGNEVKLILPGIFKKSGKETIPAGQKSGEFVLKDDLNAGARGYRVLDSHDASLAPRNGTIDVT